MQKIRFFVQRHGKHNGDLTEEGVQQVQAAAKRHFAGIQFDCAFSSDQPRARQTAEQALIAIGQEQLIGNIRTDLGFGYRFAEDPQWPHESLLKQLADAEREGHTITVDFVLSVLRDSPCLKVAGGLLLTMHQWAQRLSERSSTSPTINVLVGSHGTNVLAALEPKTTPWAKYADIMCYEFEVNEQGESTLVSSRYLPASE